MQCCALVLVVLTRAYSYCLLLTVAVEQNFDKPLRAGVLDLQLFETIAANGGNLLFIPNKAAQHRIDKAGGA